MDAFYFNFFFFFNKVRERNIRIITFQMKKKTFATNSIGYHILPDIKASLRIFVQND